MSGETNEKQIIIDKLQKIKSTLIKIEETESELQENGALIRGFKDEKKNDNVYFEKKSTNAYSNKLIILTDEYYNRKIKLIGLISAIFIAAVIAVATFCISNLWGYSYRVAGTEQYDLYYAFLVIFVVFVALISLCALFFIESKVKGDKGDIRVASIRTFLLTLGLTAVFVTGVLVYNGVVAPSANYNKAKELIAEGNYYEAYIIYDDLRDYEDSAVQKAKIKDKAFEQGYANALELYGDGEYDDANDIFVQLGDYKDSAFYVDKISARPLTEDFRDAKVGDEVIFGTAKKKEEISWIVLAKDEEKALVICKDVLPDPLIGDIEYHKFTLSDPKWEGSTLREALNTDFLTAYFTEDEQKAIASVTIENTANPTYGTSGGANTEDKLFELSIEEAKKYLSGSQLIATDKNKVARRWWLRSPGESDATAALVDEKGTIDEKGDGIVMTFDVYARPAMYIYID